MLWHPWGWPRCALELAEGQALRMATVAWRVGAGGHCRLAGVQLTQGSPVVVTQDVFHQEPTAPCAGLSHAGGSSVPFLLAKHKSAWNPNPLLSLQLSGSV